MIYQELINYIKEELKIGKNKEEIKSILLANNWKEEDIEETFNFIFNSEQQTEKKESLSVLSSNFPSIRQLLIESWLIYKERILTLLGIVVIPYLFISIIAIFFGLFLSVSNKILSPDSFIIGYIVVFFLILLLLIIIITSLIIYNWSYAALIYVLKDKEEKIGIKESYKRAKGKIFSLLWISFLSALIILFGFFLFLVPGIIFAVWFSLASFVLICEDIKGKKALLKSKEYIKGNTGKVFLRFLVLGTIFFAFVFIFNLTLSLVFPYQEGTHPELIQEISGTLFNIFGVPYLMIYSFLIYNYLKTVKK